MRNLFKKSLTLCLVAILAFSCFAGIVSAENTFTATIAVENQTITPGTTSVDVVLDITSSQIGINEALIKVSSTVGSIDAEAILVKDAAGTAYTEEELKSLHYYVDYPHESTDLGSFFLSARTIDGVLGGVDSAFIKVVFTVDADIAVADYPVKIDVSGVKAASAAEDVIKFTYEEANISVVAPHVHEYKYTPNEGDTHTYDCSTCENFDPVTEACTLENGACIYCLDPQEEVVCEHEEASATLIDVTETGFEYSCTCTKCQDTYTKNVPIGELASEPGLVSNTIYPEVDVSLYFHYLQTSVSDYSNLTVVYEKEVYESEATEPNIDSDFITQYEAATVTLGSTDYPVWRFIISDITGYEMSNNVTVKLYGMKDGTMYCLKTKSYSVVSFFTEMYSKSNNDVQKKLYVDMSNYGAAVQKLGKYNVNNLANSWVVGEIVNSGTTQYPTASSDFVAIDTTSQTNPNADSSIKVQNALTLEFGKKINMIYYFLLDNVQATDLYFEFDYYDGKAVKTNVVLPYSGYETANGYPGIIFDKTSPAVMDYPVGLTVWKGDPENGGVWLYKRNYNLETFFNQLYDGATSERQLVYQTSYAYGKTLKELAGLEDYTAE